MSSGALLLVIAHPDDEHLCGSGTLAAWAARGAPVHVVCATRGEHGPIVDPALATRETLAEVRERELRASCRELGAKSVTFLDLPDGGVSWAAAESGSAAVLVRMIRDLRPSAMISFGEDGVYGHSDHVAVHTLTIEARAAAADPALHGLPAYRVPRLFYPVWTEAWVRELLAALPGTKLWDIEPQHFSARRTPNTFDVDVSSVLERKLRALHCHRTQLAADNALGRASGAIAQRFLGHEYFACADGLATGPLQVT